MRQSQESDSVGLMPRELRSRGFQCRSGRRHVVQNDDSRAADTRGIGDSKRILDVLEPIGARQFGLWRGVFVAIDRDRVELQVRCRSHCSFRHLVYLIISAFSCTLRR